MPYGVLSVNYMVKCGQSGWTKLDLDWQNWPISSKLTGDLPHGEGNIPLRLQVHTFNPLEAALPRVNVPNHVRSHQLKNEGWPISSKLTGDLPYGEGNISWRQQVHN